MQTYYGTIDLEREIIKKGSKDIPFNQIEIKDKKECPKRNWRKGFKIGAIIGLCGAAIFTIIFTMQSPDGILIGLMLAIYCGLLYGGIGALIGLFFKKKPIDIKLTVIDNEGDIIEIDTNEDIYDKMKLYIYQREIKEKQEQELLQKVQNIVQNKEITENIPVQKQEIKQESPKVTTINKDQQTLDYVGKLKELKDLFDSGALDESEYKTLKEDVLSKYRQTL